MANFEILPEAKYDGLYVFLSLFADINGSFYGVEYFILGISLVWEILYEIKFFLNESTLFEFIVFFKPYYWLWSNLFN